MPTWSEHIAEAADYLRSNDIDDAELNAEYIACHCLDVWKRSELKLFFDNTPTPDQQLLFKSFIDRRIAREPLQYIIGETEFFGLRLFCDPSALIPRAETEIIVEEALKEAERILQTQDSLSIIDIGTGSGAIILALASKLPQAICTGVDISNDALALAEKNRARLGLKNVVFLKKDFLDEANPINESFDLVVSNPPYIPGNEISVLAEEVKDFEPFVALTDGCDGFTFYTQIAKKSASLLKENGSIIVETEFKGAPKVRTVFQEYGLKIERTVTDLLSYERAVVARKK